MGDEYGNLIGRYDELFGKIGRIPTLTGTYIRRKMELGSALAWGEGRAPCRL